MGLLKRHGRDYRLGFCYCYCLPFIFEQTFDILFVSNLALFPIILVQSLWSLSLSSYRSHVSYRACAHSHQLYSNHCIKRQYIFSNHYTLSTHHIKTDSISYLVAKYIINGIFLTINDFFLFKSQVVCAALCSTYTFNEYVP